MIYTVGCWLNGKGGDERREGGMERKKEWERERGAHEDISLLVAYKNNQRMRKLHFPVISKYCLGDPVYWVGKRVCSEHDGTGI